MAYYKIQDTTLTAIADSIRAKNGTMDPIKVNDIPSAISQIETGGSPVFNIAYGDTAPEDTSKLWVKCPEPTAITMTSAPVVGNEDLEEFIAALTEGTYGMAGAAVGTKIYLFGGSGASYLSTIQVFDTQTSTLSTCGATLPTAALYMSAAAVGTKIYLFGGYVNGSNLNAIHVYDTQADTLTTLSVTLPSASNGIAAVSVGTKIYLFGGGYGTYSYTLSTISVFDTVTGTLNILATKLPVRAYRMGGVAVGTKIYLFGGHSIIDRTVANNEFLSSILEFDTQTNTIRTLTTTLPEPMCCVEAVAIGSKIYLFGGREVDASLGQAYGGDGLTTIQVFDTTTESLSTLTPALPTKTYLCSAVNVETYVYLFGGFTDNVFLSGIHKFIAQLPLAENNLLVEVSGTKNMMQLLSGVEMGITNVYLGNAEGIAEKVPAYLNIDSVWKEI